VGEAVKTNAVFSLWNLVVKGETWIPMKGGVIGAGQ
jgi:hypothetical protein